MRLPRTHVGDKLVIHNVSIYAERFDDPEKCHQFIVRKFACNFDMAFGRHNDEWAFGEVKVKGEPFRAVECMLGNISFGVAGVAFLCLTNNRVGTR